MLKWKENLINCFGRVTNMLYMFQSRGLRRSSEQMPVCRQQGICADDSTRSHQLPHACVQHVWDLPGASWFLGPPKPSTTHIQITQCMRQKPEVRNAWDWSQRWGMEIPTWRLIPGCSTNPPVLLRAFCHVSVGTQRDAPRDLEGNILSYGTIPQKATLSALQQHW